MRVASVEKRNHPAPKRGAEYYAAGCQLSGFKFLNTRRAAERDTYFPWVRPFGCVLRLRRPRVRAA